MWYVDYPSTCGRYDEGKFVATKMCCACGGGKETQPERKKYVCLDTEDKQKCDDNDEERMCGDEFGDGCEWYNSFYNITEGIAYN